jgi:D-alanine--poly(phosphoribitol) ligase subunit 2
MAAMDELDTLLKSEFPAINFEKEDKLVENGLLDSLALFQLMGILELKYGLSIPIEEITPENFNTKTAISLLIKKLSQSNFIS